MKRHLAIVQSLAAVPLLSGCIAWEIRDGIRETNQHLCEVKPALVHVLHSDEETNRQVEQANANLVEVQESMARTQAMLADLHASLRQTDEHLTAVGSTLGETNPQLHDLDGGLERMRILSDVHASLKEVNATLGPLSKAMGSLGGAMSFLGMGGADSSKDLLADEEATDAGTSAAAPTGSKADVGGASDAAVGTATSKRPDPILGTWVMVYPPAAPAAGSSRAIGRIFVLMGDGKFLTAEDGKPPISGRWVRKGRMLTVTPDPAPAGGGGSASLPAETVELLTLNSRTLTVRNGDSIRVHARP